MSEDPPNLSARPSMIRSSAIFAGLTFVSRIAGLARDLVISAVMGASKTIAADAYFTALAFPNLFRRIFAEGAMAAAFVPAYSKKLTGEGSEEADQLAAETLAVIALASVIVTVAFQLAMPWVMRFYSPGFLEDPAKFKLAVILTQITMPYLPCMVIASMFSGILNARGRFIISGFYPTILNLVMLAVILPQSDPIRAAYAASFGVVVAGVSQAALVWWGAARSGARVKVLLPRMTSQVIGVVKTGGPAALANSATQINLIVSAVLASEIAGMRSWMNYADRLFQLPLSLVGVAIGIALLPRLSHAFGAGDNADAKSAMDQGLVWGLALTLPAAAALVAMPGFLIDALFTRGEFLTSDAISTGQILLHYGWGVPAFVLLRILQPAYFARGDTRTPMIYSLISVALNAVLAVALFTYVGFYGVAIATSTAAWLNVLQLWLTLKRRDYYAADARVLSKAVRVLAAAAGMGAVLLLAVWQRAQIEAVLGYKEIAVLAVVGLGGATYFALLFLFGGVTIAETKALLRRRPKAPPPEAEL